VALERKLSETWPRSNVLALNVAEQVREHLEQV
jgi:hypothetical protein